MLYSRKHHNKMVLWPRCEARARCSLYTKNMQLVRFIVKRGGCCCNLSADVALNVRFTTNGMRAKNNTIYVWREQAIIEWILWSDLGEWPPIMLVKLVNSDGTSWWWRREWSRRVNSIVACCHSVKWCTCRSGFSNRNSWNPVYVRNPPKNAL